MLVYLLLVSDVNNNILYGPGWKKINPPGARGYETFRTVIETMGGHDLNHLGQLDKIVEMSVRS